MVGNLLAVAITVRKENNFTESCPKNVKQKQETRQPDKPRNVYISCRLCTKGIIQRKLTGVDTIGSNDKNCFSGVVLGIIFNF